MTSSIPPPGEEATFPLNNEGLAVRHGSSLSLMTNVCEFLANPIQDDTFNYVDPTAVSMYFFVLFLVHLDHALMYINLYFFVLFLVHLDVSCLS